ncbi:MAG: radical SAM protein [Lachnospiraceae bacterium]|nr:radical SAM protein [Lachnospiraceae bacterium]
MNKLTAIRWDIEPACNLSCKHCLVSKVKYPEKISLLENKLIAKKLIDFGVKRMVFQSKEPLLYQGICNLIAFCSNRGIVTGLATNGTLLNEDLINELIDSNLSFLAISLEGITPYSNDLIRGEGTFNVIMRNIKLLDAAMRKKNKYIQLALEMCLHKGNINEVSSMIEYFSNLPFSIINIGDIAMIGEAKKNDYLAISKLETEEAYAKLFFDFSRLGKKQFGIAPKSSMPYENIYYNTIYGLDIPFHLPSCSITKGVYSISADGHIAGCNFIKDNKPDVLIDFESDFKNMEYGGVEKVINKNNEFFSAMLKPNYKANPDCQTCLHKENCTFCPMPNDDCKGSDIERCNRYKEKLRELFSLMKNKGMPFSIASGVFADFDENGCKAYRVFFDSSVKELEIAKAHAALFIDIYKAHDDLRYSMFCENEWADELLRLLLSEGYLELKGDQ